MYVFNFNLSLYPYFQIVLEFNRISLKDANACLAAFYKDYIRALSLIMDGIADKPNHSLADMLNCLLQAGCGAPEKKDRYGKNYSLVYMFKVVTMYSLSIPLNGRMLAVFAVFRLLPSSPMQAHLFFDFHCTLTPLNAEHLFHHKYMSTPDE